MTKMLLVHLPHTDRIPSLVPIGIALIADAAKSAGAEVEIYDIFALGHTMEQVAEYLKSKRWDILGISAFSTQYRWAKWIAAEFRKCHPDSIIVMGGPLATFNAEVVIEKTETDVCVISEGEETIKALLANLSNFSKVSGIVYKSANGELVTTTPRPYIQNLDTIPFTRYDLFAMDLYLKYMQGGVGTPRAKTINMLTSRGCPYSCKYCSRGFVGSRIRSVDNIVTEIATLKDRYGINAVTFDDELVLVSKKRGYELCEKIKPLKIYWACQGRANIVDLDLLKTMKNSGCVSVGVGVESGSQKILDSMNKRSTVAQNEAAITNILKAGMTPIVQMIYGFPGENLDTIRETVDFFDRVHFYPPIAAGECWLSLLTLLPGSPLYNEAKSAGKIQNEEEYLLGLESGYYIGSPLRINLTEFSDQDLLKNKDLMSREIVGNYKAYVEKHPLIRLKKYRRVLTDIRNVEGIMGIVKEAVWRIARRYNKKSALS